MALARLRSSFDNPIDRAKLPREALHLRWPVRDFAKKDYVIRSLVCLFVLSIAPLILEVFFPALVALFAKIGTVGIWLGLVALIIFLRIEWAPRPVFWCYVGGGIATVGLRHAPPIMLEFGACFLSPFFVWQFRKHYLEYCTATPIPRAVADLFKRSRVLPATVTPIPVGQDLWNAIVNWIGYNPRDSKLPGQWTSPAGSIATRTFYTVSVVGFLAAAIPHHVLEKAGQSDAFNSMDFGLGLLVVHLLPMTVLLASVLLGSYSILGKAGGLRRSATLANYFDELQTDLNSSPNTIERDSLLVGSVTADSSPILLPLKVAGSHIWIAGTTGCGKTAMLMCLLEQFLHRGYSVVCLDLKNDTFELLHTLLAVMGKSPTPICPWFFTDRYQWATQFCSPFSQSYWKRLGPTERTNIHLSSMGLGFSRDHGESWYGDASYQVLDFVNRKYPNIQSYEELDEKIAYEIAHARPHELSKVVKRDGEHVGLIVRRLSHVEMFNPKPSHPKSAIAAGLDYQSLFTNQGVAYWGLNSLVASVNSPEISRVVLANVLAAATSAGVRKRNIVLVIDEFQQMVAPGVLQLALRQARSLGITVILSNQTVDDLKTHKNNFVPTVEGNTATQMWLSGSGRDSIDQIQRLGGKTIDYIYGYSTNSDGQRSVSRQEVIVDRFDATTIAEVSSNRNSFITRITSNEGYAQYNGIPFIAQSEYHINQTEYSKRSNAPWPALSGDSVLVGQSVSQVPATSSIAAVPSLTNQAVPLPAAKSRNVIRSGTIGGKRP